MKSRESLLWKCEKRKKKFGNKWERRGVKVKLDYRCEDDLYYLYLSLGTGPDRVQR